MMTNKHPEFNINDYTKNNPELAKEVEKERKKQAKTNYDKIRNMTIEEMAELLTFWECDNGCAYGEMKDCLSDDKGCYNGIKQWLESEVE